MRRRAQPLSRGSSVPAGIEECRGTRQGWESVEREGVAKMFFWQVFPWRRARFLHRNAYAKQTGAPTHNSGTRASRVYHPDYIGARLDFTRDLRARSFSCYGPDKTRPKVYAQSYYKLISTARGIWCLRHRALCCDQLRYSDLWCCV